MCLRLLPLLPLAALLLSCSGDGPTDGGGGGARPGPPAKVEPVSGDGQTARVATKLPSALVVKVTDASGKAVSGATVAWAVGAGTLSASSTPTDTNGEARAEWTLGTAAGAQQATATVSGVPAVAFGARAIPGDPAGVEKVSGDGQSGAAGAALADTLAVRVKDAHGNPVEGAAVGWEVTGGGGSVSALSAATDAGGVVRAVWTLGSAEGTHTVSASVGGLSVGFTATGTSGGSALEIQSVAPATLTPGATATLTGKGFGATTGANTVTVAGVAASVTAASATELTVTLPAASAFPCEPTRSVEVRVTSGSSSGTRPHPLRVAAQRSLAVGESALLLGAGDARCNELPQAGRYAVSVFNTSEAKDGLTAFQLRGASGGASADVAPRLSTAPRVPRPALRAASEREVRAAEAHARLLEQNRRLLQRLGVRGLRGREGARLSRSAAAPLAVGDTLRLRIPDIKAADVCLNFQEVTGRVVYAGARAVVLEDRAAPLAGQMDADYQAMGKEFDDRMFSILEGSFGNPLAVDHLTDANGKVLMLFSKVVNDFGTVAGFVFSGDFFDRTECASSDRAELFYAVVPTSSASGFGGGTRDHWKWTMGSTVIHEVKHITSFAERLSRNASVWEESWLEESTARISEELWARAVYGYGQGQDVAYEPHVYCESRPSWPECTGKPLVMRKHFGGLYDYLASNETLTPLGKTAEGDASFYGSGWSLVRWSADHFASSEAAFLKALVQEPGLAGLDNLEARTGKDFADMLGSWSLALATDGLSGFSPADARLHFPSWNLRGVYAGLNADFPDSYTRAYPLAPRAVSGSFQVDVQQLRGGTAALFELTGPTSGGQLLELKGVSGGSPSPTLRLGIVRVQ